MKQAGDAPRNCVLWAKLLLLEEPCPYDQESGVLRGSLSLGRVLPGLWLRVKFTLKLEEGVWAELGGSHHFSTISSSVSRQFLKHGLREDPLQPHFLLLPGWGTTSFSFPCTLRAAHSIPFYSFYERIPWKRSSLKTEKGLDEFLYILMHISFLIQHETMKRA